MSISSLTSKTISILGNPEAITPLLIKDTATSYSLTQFAKRDGGSIESTDKFIWAAFSFNESFLLSFLASIETVSSFSFEKQNYENVMCIRFNKEMTKNRFEELTGIHLFELTQHTSG